MNMSAEDSLEERILLTRTEYSLWRKSLIRVTGVRIVSVMQVPLCLKVISPIYPFGYICSSHAITSAT
jgi:hypothetical protein